jgi:hypothetical protein
MAAPLQTPSPETTLQYPTFEDEDDGYTSQEDSDSNDDSTDAGFEPLEELEDSDTSDDEEEPIPELNMAGRRSYGHGIEPPAAPPEDNPPEIEPPVAPPEDDPPEEPPNDDEAARHDEPPELDEDELPELFVDYNDPTTINFLRNNNVTFARPERTIINPTGNAYAALYQHSRPLTFAATSATEEEEEIARKGEHPDGSKSVEVPKRVWRPRINAVYEEPEDILDTSGDLDWLFGEIGKVIIENKAKLAPRDDIIQYEPKKHEKEIDTNIQWRDCPEDMRQVLRELINKFYDVFAPEGMQNPIRGFEFQH